MVADVFENAGYASNSKKKSKKGFKSDRRANFEKKLNKNKKKDAKATSASRVKEVKFDDASRREFLLTMHKNKNLRRVSAFVEVKRKIRRENSKFRMKQREDARLAYNSYAQVPILPDFSYRVTPDTEPDEEDDGHDGSERKTKKMKKIAAVDLAEDRDTVVFPPLCVDDGKDGCGAVEVTVEPLFKRRRSLRLPSNDFSDLPESVAKELARLKKEQKGPSRTKAKVHQMKELEKIRKIRKHTRKGHGKSGAKGKKRNR
jgi:hypothetical protein